MAARPAAEPVLFSEEQRLPVAAAVFVAVGAGIPLWLSLQSAAVVAPLILLLAAVVWRIRVAVRLYRDRLEIHAFLCRPDSIPLGNIARFEIGTFTPARGRLLCHERTYIMRGRRGIEIVLTDGASVIVGSREPEAFAEALSRAMAA